MLASSFGFGFLIFNALFGKGEKKVEENVGGILIGGTNTRIVIA